MNVLRKNIRTATQSNTYKIYIQHVLASTNGFKSLLSLENLYPTSSLKLSTPSKPSTSMHEKFSGFVPIEKLTISYTRSSGPGGQNVNKVNTKVDLRFHLETADWLHRDIRQKLTENFKNKLTKEGFLVFKSDITRSQQMNLADCMEKLRAAIRVALQPEPEITEETAERIRRRKEKAAIERMMVKRERSLTKEGRRAPDINNT